MVPISVNYHFLYERQNIMSKPVNVFFNPKFEHPFTAKSGVEYVNVSVPPKTEGGKWGQFLVAKHNNDGTEKIKTAKSGSHYVTFSDDYQVRVSYYDKDTNSSAEAVMSPEALNSLLNPKHDVEKSQDVPERE